jgi:hypothetical protein
MKEDKLYKSLVSKMNEVSVMPPQQIGPLTPIYKMVIPQFKFAPLRTALILSMIATCMLYILFGARVVHLASLLQYGF